jgi:hypothetical protein
VISGAARVAPEKAVFRPALPMSVLPEFTGEQMATKLTYKEQLLHPNWQRKRLEVLQAAGFECSKCGTKEKTLHVHHKRYIKGRLAWEYESDELACLCEDCHETEHDARELLDRLIAEVGASGLDMILGLSAGYMTACMDLSRPLAEEIAIGRELEYEIGIVASTLDHGEDFKWRRILIEHVKKYPANPVTAFYADMWSGEQKETEKP